MKKYIKRLKSGTKKERKQQWADWCYESHYWIEIPLAPNAGQLAFKCKFCGKEDYSTISPRYEELCKNNPFVIKLLENEKK
jgi:hypothetical protein